MSTMVATRPLFDARDSPFDTLSRTYDAIQLIAPTHPALVTYSNQCES